MTEHKSRGMSRADLHTANVSDADAEILLEAFLVLESLAVYGLHDSWFEAAKHHDPFDPFEVFWCEFTMGHFPWDAAHKAQLLRELVKLPRFIEVEAEVHKRFVPDGQPFKSLSAKIELEAAVISQDIEGTDEECAPYFWMWDMTCARTNNPLAFSL